MRNCNCSGRCGTGNRDLTRREFLGLVGAGAAATLLSNPAFAAFELPADALERWRRELFAPASPRLYSSDKHTDARMHLGGLGTGNFELGADGQFTTWQLFNTLRDGEVPFYFLAKAGETTKLLQTAGGPDFPRVRSIEMTGEYPLARLRFKDDELPVQLELMAFSPFVPLDTAMASMPVTAFVFKVHNPSQREQTVSLAALLQNPVGYDAIGENKQRANPAFGGNVNEVLNEHGARGLLMRAEAAPEPTLNVPVTLYASANLSALKTPPSDRPANLRVEFIDRNPVSVEKLTDPGHTVLWLEEPAASLPAPILRSLYDLVRAGAALVFSGQTIPLLESYATWTGGQPVNAVSQKPDIIFEDFENGYGNWTVEGDAFGAAPAQGTLPNQQPVSGFVGRGLVNTYLNGDVTTGRLRSKTFTIERRFIRFLLGGGHHENTQIRLLVDGKTVRAASGKDNERLEPVVWEVGELAGKTAQIEIVDQEKGPWGHINVDQIEFSDLPGNRELMAMLEELLPARFSRVRKNGANASLDFDDLVLQPGATRSTAPNGTELLTRAVGKGKALIAAGPVLAPATAGISGARQRAYSFLCGLVGATYNASPGLNPKAPGFGTLALAVLGEKATVLPSYENWGDAWKMFAAGGHFLELGQGRPNTPAPAGQTVNGAVSATVRVPAGKTVEIPFLLAWHYPNKYSGQDPDAVWMGCHYATRWPDARAVLGEASRDFERLRRRTEAFRTSFYDSTLPYWLLDCVTANAAITRHIGVVFRIANGDVYGWEGSNGCCNPTCTHVWGYEQTLARLFPDLEKDMRRIDFTHQQRPDGGVNNRTDVPSPPRPTGEQPFADGHASCILKAYREALNHPDDSFFKEYWPHVRRGVDYLIARDAKTTGGEPAGVLQDDQWNTYDEALHGVTTFISGYYLAALLAGEAWARRIGEQAVAERFRNVFERGQTRLIELCWNGEYFQQHLPDYLDRPGEVGPGCMADQFIGQWWAHQLGLGYILPREKVVSGLKAVFKYNFKSDLTGWKHIPRAFAGAKDKGLVICTWPKGGRPGNVMLYSDEVWTGIEYQVAAHMIYEGLVEEGFAIVKGVRERYDGVPRAPISRNPWNEIECGGHYARAMSSWSLLLALSGWEYDGPRGTLRFTPRHTPENFKCFFTSPEGWGNVRQSRTGDRQVNELRVVEGRLRISEITLAAAQSSSVKVQLGARSVASSSEFRDGFLRVKLAAATTIQSGQTLRIQIG